MGVWQAVLNVIYPNRCPFCGKVLESWEEGMCRSCQTQLPWITGGEKHVEFCDSCLSPLWYEARVRRGIHRYKFQGGSVHAPLLGTLMAQCLADNWGEGADLVVWVPLSPRGLRRRGYDQAGLLARQVGALTGLPVVAALSKVRETCTQSRLTSDSARRANVSGAYAMKKGVDVGGKRVVLVDDVTTTGATLSECAACLRMAGAAQVIGLTLARAKG